MNLLKSRINDESFARNLTHWRNSGCHGFGVFDKAVSSSMDNVSEVHGLTENGKTVPPLFSVLSVSKALRPQYRNHPPFTSFHQVSLPFPLTTRQSEPQAGYFQIAENP